MVDEAKPKCPNCETELVLVEGKPPARCAKCGILMSGFPDFMKWLEAGIEKIGAKRKKDNKTDDDESPFAILGRIK